jgi:serine phosphatase RsbU (regulator of sigma subunit)
MSLRLRLIVAFFLLAVVPLSAVTFYAYTSSARALREAAEREADLLAGELGQRMQLVTTQLAERVQHVMEIAELQDTADQMAQQSAQVATTSAAPAATPTVAVYTFDQQFARNLGEAAMLLDNVDLRGLRGGMARRVPAGARGGDSSAGQADRPRIRPDTSVVPPGEVPPTPPTPLAPSAASATGPAAAEPLRIDLAPIRRELLRELVPDGRWDSLTPEQRQKLGEELRIRILGIQEGLELGAQALQQRAAAAEREMAEVAVTIPPAPVPPLPPPPPSAPSPATAVKVVHKSEVTGNRLDIRLERDGQVVRQLNAEINVPNLLATVFSTTRRDRAEVPFAFTADGELFTPGPDDTKAVAALGDVVPKSGPAVVRTANWVIVTTSDPSGSGLTLGIARPVGDSLAELRRTSARNAGLGVLFITLALVGIVPLSSRLTRNLSVLREGVRKIARGDYRTRVAVNSRDEVGELAEAFNKMAEDVERHQRAAIEQERIKRELELGRQIQHEMLPHVPLRLGPTEIKGVSVPAREVGGDFFNYFQLPSGEIALLVGDVSGKGVGAALLMANIQAALRTRLAMGQDLAVLADELDREIEAGSPGPVYATLFVAILDPVSRVLRYVNAGHNPQYVLGADRRLDRMPSTGLPIGMLAGRGYQEERIQLVAGDVLFFYTDGCVEVENDRDEMLGIEELESLLVGANAGGTEDVLVRVESAVHSFRGARDLFDDATMMAVKVG